MNDITALALLVSKAKASVFTMEYISQFEASDIDSDDVDLRFEVDGVETGTNVSIVDECGQAAQMITALVEALEKAQRAANINNWWKPDVCPITGRRFFMWIEHPELGYVPTYGGPFDSYTIPTRDDVGEFSCERYDHDFGGWVDDECAGLYVIDEDEICRVHDLEQRIASLESRTVKLPPRVDSSNVPFTAHTWNCCLDAVEKCLTAAGIQVIEGE